MAKKTANFIKQLTKDSLHTQTRKKLGLSQAQLAAIMQVSRTHLAMIETGKRNLQSTSNTALLNMFQHFRNLETGSQPANRSVETRLFLNEEYKKILPKMKLLEQDCRLHLKLLKRDLSVMKERARDAEHAIIVFTSAIHNLEESGEPGSRTEKMITGLNLFKQQAYDNFLTCWEPEQAKLHGKIEAIAGEAKALRRYRVKVMREHMPIKNNR